MRTQELCGLTAMTAVTCLCPLRDWWACSANLVSSFSEGSDHDNDSNPVFPHHSPHVTHRVLQWSCSIQRKPHHDQKFRYNIGGKHYPELQCMSSVSHLIPVAMTAIIYYLSLSHQSNLHWHSLIHLLPWSLASLYRHHLHFQVTKTIIPQCCSIIDIKPIHHIYHSHTLLARRWPRFYTVVTDMILWQCCSGSWLYWKAWVPHLPSTSPLPPHPIQCV